MLPASDPRSRRAEEEAGGRRPTPAAPRPKERPRKSRSRRKRSGRRRRRRRSSWRRLPAVGAGRRCGGSRRSRPRRSPTSSFRATPSAPARRARSRFPSTSASTSRSGSRPRPPRPRRAASRRRRRAAAPSADGRRRRRPAASVRAAAAVPPARRRRRKKAPVTLGGREQRQLKRKKAATVRAAQARGRAKRSAAAAPSRERTHIRRTGTNTAAPRERTSSRRVALHGAEFLRGHRRARPRHPGQAARTGHDEQHRRHARLRRWPSCWRSELGVAGQLPPAPSTWSRQVLQSLEARGRPGEARSRGRRSSPSSATWTTARRRCWTGSSASTWPRTKRAASPSTSAPTASRRTAGRSPSSIRRATRPSPKCAPAAPTSPTSPCWSWRPTTASCRRPKRPSATPGPPSVPIVVALNKIDLPGANPQRVLRAVGGQRAAAQRVGRRNRSGQDQRHDRRGHRRAAGNAADGGRVARVQGQSRSPGPRHLPGSRDCTRAAAWWPSCWCRTARCDVGDVVVCGSAYGRVKAMYDTLKPRKKHDEAGPSTPVNVTGLNCAPAPATASTCWTTSPRPAQLAEQRAAEARQRELGGVQPHVTLETLYERLGEESKVQTLNIILRADVRGSIEAIRKELTKLRAPRGADQDPAGHGGRHHRGRRPPGRRLRRDDHRLQRGARRKGPRAGRQAGRADPPLRHHLPGDRRLEGGPGRHAQAGEAGEGTGPGAGAADVPHQPRGHAWPAAACWPASSSATPACA